MESVAELTIGGIAEPIPCIGAAFTVKAPPGDDGMPDHDRRTIMLELYINRLEGMLAPDTREKLHELFEKREVTQFECAFWIGNKNNPAFTRVRFLGRITAHMVKHGKIDTYYPAQNYPSIIYLIAEPTIGHLIGGQPFEIIEEIST
jgi:hypothetical protein